MLHFEIEPTTFLLMKDEGLNQYTILIIIFLTLCCHRNVSEAFQRALMGTVVKPVETLEARLQEEVSHIGTTGTQVVEMLARCLPHIIPNVLLAKREVKKKKMYNEKIYI